ncbi:glycoside hydrolase family 105 protein [Fomitopsis serialis]|uniref:glycoside hydrolase family 105 protein n=1 Tax=Fomitopsis serialis TaxID=139415 RepID=UPI002007FF10|nr:glycoside hydrolase family 105 protein [Neoantrodia serialis]KAH9923624.1 glycoside hydrolase family 105 protein [Neoantrodia serialis]
MGTTYSTWAADSTIARGQGNGLNASGDPVVTYEHGELQWALRLLYDKTGNKSYYDYIVEGIDNILYENGSSSVSASEYSLDYIPPGRSFLYLYNQIGDERYKVGADDFRAQLETQPRTPEGQFWHKGAYPEQGWLDGIYMGDVFYATYTAAFQPTNRSAWVHRTIQSLHPIASSTNRMGTPNRGHSPEVWDRAVGWYLAPQTDETFFLRTTIQSQLQILARHLVTAADSESGPGRAGNYFESSGASMYIYALLKGVRLSYLDDADGLLVAAATKAYEYATANWVIPQPDGTMDWNNTVVVGSLEPGNDYEYYISEPIDTNDLKGLAAFILASLEYETLA